MDCSLPGSSVHGISQVRILEKAAHFLLQGIFPTQGSSPHHLSLLHWQEDSLPLAPPGKPQEPFDTGQVKFPKHLFVLNDTGRSFLKELWWWDNVAKAPHRAWCISSYYYFMDVIMLGLSGETKMNQETCLPSWNLERMKQMPKL